jgi:hypothetical protein
LPDQHSSPAAPSTVPPPVSPELSHAFAVVAVDEPAWRAALPGAAAPTTSAIPAFVVVQQALGAAVAPLLHPAAGVDLIRLAVLDVDVTITLDVTEGARPVATSRIVARAAHELGTTTTVGVDVDVDGRRACSLRLTFLARAPRRRQDPAVVTAARDEDDARFLALPRHFVEDIALDERAPSAFARACCNDDPVGLDGDGARMAGLPAPVVPLAGVIALVWDATVRHCAPRRVRRLQFTPLLPVLGGDRLQCEARSVDGDHLRLRLQHAPASAGRGLVASVVVELA